MPVDDLKGTVKNSQKTAQIVTTLRCNHPLPGKRQHAQSDSVMMLAVARMTWAGREAICTEHDVNFARCERKGTNLDRQCGN